MKLPISRIDSRNARLRCGSLGQLGSLENMAFFARGRFLVPLVELTVTSSGVSSTWDPRVLLRMKKIYFPSQRHQDVEPKNREETLRATRINVFNDVLNISDISNIWITVRRDMWR